MTQTTESLIGMLAEQAKPVQAVRGVAWTLASGSALILLYVFAFLYIAGQRPDLLVMLNQPLFLSEVLVSSFCILFSLIAAAYHARPDLAERRGVTQLPWVMLTLFCGVYVAEALFPLPPTPHPPHAGMSCLTALCFLSVLPAGLLFVLLARGVFLHLKQASLVIALASAMTGHLALRLAEPTNDIAHLLLWHLLPMIGMIGLLTALHLWLGRHKTI